MNVDIYYFSGTGNSFAVARDLAEKLDAGLHSISKSIDEDDSIIDSRSVGFVFPDYHSNVPNIVRRFIERINSLEGKYVFGICTFGHDPGPTLKYLEKLINSKNGKLSAGFAVKMPYNYIKPKFSFKGTSVELEEIPKDEQKKMFIKWKDRLDEICDVILNKEEMDIESNSELLFKLIDLFKLKDTLGKLVWLRTAGFKGKTGLNFSESIRFMDHGFHVNEDCISCGTCEDVCPVDNVKIIDGRPSWKHRCEQCFGCFHWCPKSAIQFGDGTEDAERYHHPEVKISEMIDY